MIAAFYVIIVLTQWVTVGSLFSRCWKLRSRGIFNPSNCKAPRKHVGGCESSNKSRWSRVARWSFAISHECLSLCTARKAGRVEESKFNCRLHDLFPSRLFFPSLPLPPFDRDSLAWVAKLFQFLLRAFSVLVGEAKISSTIRFTWQQRRKLVAKWKKSQCRRNAKDSLAFCERDYGRKGFSVD